MTGRPQAKIRPNLATGNRLVIAVGRYDAASWRELWIDAKHAKFVLTTLTTHPREAVRQYSALQVPGEVPLHVPGQATPHFARLRPYSPTCPSPATPRQGRA